MRSSNARVIIQEMMDPVPEFIVKNTLRNLGLTKKDYFAKMGQQDKKKR